MKCIKVPICPKYPETLSAQHVSISMINYLARPTQPSIHANIPFHSNIKPSLLSNPHTGHDRTLRDAVQEQPFMFGVMPCPLRNPAPHSISKLPCIPVLRFSPEFPHINLGNSNVLLAFSLPPLCFLYSCYLLAVHRNQRARIPTAPAEVLFKGPNELLKWPVILCRKVNIGICISSQDTFPIYSPGLGVVVLNTVKLGRSGRHAVCAERTK